MENQKKYAMIQVPTEIHELLKEHCNQNGFKIGAIVSILIKKHLKK
jgi:hypothetical protein